MGNVKFSSNSSETNDINVECISVCSDEACLPHPPHHQGGVGGCFSRDTAVTLGGVRPRCHHLLTEPRGRGGAGMKMLVTLCWPLLILLLVFLSFCPRRSLLSFVLFLPGFGIKYRMKFFADENDFKYVFVHLFLSRYHWVRPSGVQRDISTVK